MGVGVSAREIYPKGCLVGGGGVSTEGWGCTPHPSPLWTEFLSHACENITFPQLRLRTVNILRNSLGMDVCLGYLFAFYLYKVLRDNDVTEEDLMRDDDDSREHPTADIPMEHHDSRSQNQHEHEHESIIPQVAQVIPKLE